MGALSGIDIVILVSEGVTFIGLLAGNIIWGRKLKKLRAENKIHQNRIQKEVLDEMLKNMKRR